jgi:hypothetical protein
MNIHHLKLIKDRYFASCKKEILHFGDCEIYINRRNFCGCGLLHDLAYLDHGFACILYKKYEDEIYLQSCGKKKPKKETPKMKEAVRLLEAVFGKIGLRNDLTDIKFTYDEYKSTLKKMFPTKKEFPGAYKRLKLWLQKELAKPLA